ncbi:homing endonuclease [Bacillus phage vB_BanS_Sophrita]|uniref:GIY-YIG endonuclease n=1 Tax=Bacillus phage vB_BanS_Sophrita TaxID=2894790 RepID=A0AAE9CE56_9CAUD|nr:homing endonuclease [Bacillus phage vB_BanS_Sophrita]UGO50761.1 GIY-YIG endonuclease [Bacillus phage vB_BanS_Sophrita]
MYGISGIYRITNKINGKSYIGSSVNIGIRFNKHLSMLRNNKHVSKHLQHAFNKYGECNFYISVIEEVNEQNLLEREDYYIDLYDACNRRFGYNSTSATRREGYSHSEETKRKISEAQIGRVFTEETRKRISDALRAKGERLDKDTRRRIAEHNRRLHMSEEVENEIRRLILEGKQGKEISKMFGYSPNVISRLKRRMEEEGLLLSKKERDRLIKEDLSNGLTVNEIAEKYNVTKETVRNRRMEMK